MAEALNSRTPRSHAVAATILGFFFGLFLSLFLVLAGWIPMDSVLVEILPTAFLVIGLALGLVARSAVRRAGATAPVGPVTEEALEVSPPPP